MRLRGELNRRGSIFQSTSDTEVIIHLVATSSYRTLLDRFIDALKQVEGAYSPGLPDRRGHDRLPRPARHPPAGHGPARRRLYLRLRDGGARRGRRDLFALGRARRADRGLRPGRALAPPVRAAAAPALHLRACLFLAARLRRRRPFGLQRPQADRRRAGASRARSRPIMSCRCPTAACRRRSAMPSRAGIPFELGIIRSHYVGRTFIQPGDQVRHLGVKLKHNANSALIEGKRIVLVDDSIVRGTTSLKIVQMMREAGAREVHMRIASPPTRHSCFYGVDTPERAKLLAAQMNVAEMNNYIERRQPRLRLDRRPLPRARRERARRGRAAALRRLLHRRLSDRPDRPGGSGANGTSSSSRRSASPDAGSVRGQDWRWSPARAAGSARRSPRRWRPRARMSS